MDRRIATLLAAAGFYFCAAGVFGALAQEQRADPAIMLNYCVADRNSAENQSEAWRAINDKKVADLERQLSEARKEIAELKKAKEEPKP